MTDWQETREQFRTAVNMRRRAGCTVPEIAAAIPCAIKTVYRLMTNVERPTLALRKNVEKFVSKASQVTRLPVQPDES